MASAPRLPDPWSLPGCEIGVEDRWQAMTAEIRPALDPTSALAEGMRCLLCGGPYAAAPCTVACPAEVDVPGFIEALGDGRTDKAARIIWQQNALGATCARVCPTEVLCEGACVLLHEGQRAVAIGRLQRFAMDAALAKPPALTASPRPQTGGRSVAVIGAGPAGLAAAAELAGQGHEVTVYDDRPEIGGLVRYAIAPFRQVDDPLPSERERLTQMGVRLRLHAPVDTPEALRQIERGHDAIVLAVGMGEDASAGCEGEDLAGVWPSLAFVSAIKQGMLPVVGARVVVVGGGNTAMDMAREAVRLRAREVTVLYRRTEAEMPAYRHEVEEARAEGVRFSWLTQPVRFLGRGGALTAVECRYMRLGDADATGRHRPEPVAGTEFTLAVDTALVAVGQKPRAAFLSWVEGLELRDGRITCDEATGATANPRYFAAGDAVNGGDTVVMAVRMGKRAARGVSAFLAKAGAPS